MGRLTFVTGSARSGKSRFAEELATAAGVPVVYVATMGDVDGETAERVARHRARRPAAWQTVEEPLDLAGAVAGCDGGEMVLVDCLSLWVANLLMQHMAGRHETPGAFEAAIDSCLEAADRTLAMQRERTGPMVAVSNEVGWSIVPADRLSRYYRDALGLVNQRFARAADEAILLVSGLPLWLSRRGATGQGDARVSERGPQSARIGGSPGCSAGT